MSSADVSDIRFERPFSVNPLYGLFNACSEARSNSLAEGCASSGLLNRESDGDGALAA